MPSRSTLRAAVVAASLAAATIAQAFPLYRVKDLGTLGGDISFGAAIARGKLVAGSSTTSTADPPYYHAFLVRKGAMNDLGALWDGGDSFAASVNAAGQACGYATWTNYLGHAVIYANGGITDLGAMRDDFEVSEANGINTTGHVAGDEYDRDSLDHAFFYSDGHFRVFDAGTKANGLNDRDQMIGIAAGVAAIFEHGQATPLGSLGGGYSEGFALNNVGLATGWSLMPDGVTYHAFVWFEGSMFDLGTLGGSQSQGMAINGEGVIVGWSYTSGDAVQHAFVALLGHMVDLNDLLDPVTGQGWTIANADGIDDLGRIVGTGIHDGQYHAFELAPMVP
jgi:probable HAF family extracellular repeat protein